MATFDRTRNKPSASKMLFMRCVITMTILRTSTAICSYIIPHSCTCIDEPRTMLCVETNLTTFPGDLPDATHMDIKGNAIGIIEKPIPYVGLRSLILDRNHIAHIADRAFENLTNLTKLSVAHNKLSNLTADTFYGLQSLRFLILDHNPISQLVPSMLSGGHLRSLQILELSNCNIRTIENGVFYGTPKLQHLDLSHNSISEFPDFAELGNLQQLQHLDMSHNRISSIGEHRCNRLTSLKFLNLCDNSICHILPQSLHGVLQTLIVLDFSENSLVDVSSALCNAHALTDLFLQNNSLRAIDQHTLPWNSLQKILVHDNPWHCDCTTSWLLKHKIVSQWIAQGTTRCASPPSVAGRMVLDVDENVFRNCTQARDRRVSAASLICVSIGIVVVLATIAVTFRFLMQRGVFLIGRGRKYRASSLMMTIANAAPPYRRV